MPLSDAAAREIANILRKHVGTKTLEQIVNELLEIRGDKDFRDTIERLVTRCGCLIGDHQRIRSCATRLRPDSLILRSRQKALADWHAVRARSK